LQDMLSNYLPYNFPCVEKAQINLSESSSSQKNIKVR